jgi:hypothetical protein
VMRQAAAPLLSSPFSMKFAPKRRGEDDNPYKLLLMVGRAVVRAGDGGNVQLWLELDGVVLRWPACFGSMGKWLGSSARHGRRRSGTATARCSVWRQRWGKLVQEVVGPLLVGERGHVGVGLHP